MIVKELLETRQAPNADLKGADLRRADLRRANLRRANLQEAYLGWANLQGAILHGAILQGANLQGADLWRANLRGTDLQETDLQGTDLQGAILQETDLRDADLRNADLRNADLHCSIDAPIMMQIDSWLIYIKGGYMSIGCEYYEVDNWRAFTDEEIRRMDPRKALDFWRRHREWLLACCDAQIKATEEALKQQGEKDGEEALL